MCGWIFYFFSSKFKEAPKITKYFNGTAISTFFALKSPGDFPIIFILNFNDIEFAKVDVHEQLSLYSIKSYIDITTSICFAQSFWVLVISLMQSVNGSL